MFLLFILPFGLTGPIVVSVSPPAAQACKHSERRVVVYRDFVFSSSFEEAVLISRKELNRVITKLKGTSGSLQYKETLVVDCWDVKYTALTHTNLALGHPACLNQYHSSANFQQPYIVQLITALMRSSTMKGSSPAFMPRLATSHLHPSLFKALYKLDICLQLIDILDTSQSDYEAMLSMTFPAVTLLSSFTYVAFGRYTLRILLHPQDRMYHISFRGSIS
ncbi:hypothetical protein Baya_11011 [Bagarius yarrelli]|uniref:Uncharacterized protein n=1 Tax=Bagarius yarrelli TaxID=175774 RepID=A0A556UYM9_BAGYA|nr:hypothetical protein Baya_11011 [Bagarius yarrelli]